MWIQVRTIDGTETRTVEDLSRLTKIESLRLKIQEIFNVDPERQRLFYRGKQVRNHSFYVFQARVYLSVFVLLFWHIAMLLASQVANLEG